MVQLHNSHPCGTVDYMVGLAKDLAKRRDELAEHIMRKLYGIYIATTGNGDDMAGTSMPLVSHRVLLMIMCYPHNLRGWPLQTCVHGLHC